MNFIIGIIAAIVGAVVNAAQGDWVTVTWCLIAAAWASLAYVENRSVKRYKALALARKVHASRWPEPGTVRQTTTGHYEVWVGGKWVKV